MSNKLQTPAVILAGGKSSRMGKDKTLLPFRGYPTLTHFCYDRFSQIFKSVFVSSKELKFEPNLPLIKDDFDSFSPMGALAVVLENFKDEFVFINPADMPFTSENAIKTLHANLKGVKICLAKDSEFTHSLCGFYHSSLAPKAREFYEKGKHKIGLLFKEANFKTIEFDEKFYNINYPDEYENLKEKK